MPKIWLMIASLSGFLAVALGAFGAHGLSGKISDSLLSAFQTGTYYQMFHTLALFALAVLAMQLDHMPKAIIVSAYCWIAGIMLFSGSLYGLALGGPVWLGPVTPLGGLLLMLGWLSLVLGFTTGNIEHKV
ncbi:MAG: uncharacterized membrane protein YgdD (TMEM256/DUF423 family) [Cellvibrionaceae bacterium]|jgi:uncharacterized membrane protein YgdD (TMEM256/DUF423 family)